MRFHRRTEGLLKVELVRGKKAYWAAKVRTIDMDAKLSQFCKTSPHHLRCRIIEAKNCGHNIWGHFPSICRSVGLNCIQVCTGSCKVREILGEHLEGIRRLLAELGHGMILRFDNLIKLEDGSFSELQCICDVGCHVIARTI